MRCSESIGRAAAVVLATCICGAIVQSQDAPPPAAQAEPVRPAGSGIPRQNLFAQKYHFTLYEVEQFSERLGLSAEQHELFVLMFSAMQERVMEAERPLLDSEKAWKELYNDSMFNKESEWQSSREKAVEALDLLDEIQSKTDKLEIEWVELQKKLAEELIADLRLILDAEQLGRLDEAIRWRHRARLLRWNELPYGKLMVSAIARSMDLQPDPSRFGGDEASMLDELYREYEIELDGLLLERAAVERELLGIARGMGGDPDMIGIGFVEPEELAWLEAVGAVNVRLVAMQKKYIRRIASLVDPERAVAFENRCREEAYPYVLMRSNAQQALESLASDERLSVEQRERAAQMLASHTSERTALTERWVRMIEELVADRNPRILASAVPLDIGDPHALRRGDRRFLEISAERKALDERWAKRVQDFRSELNLDASAEEEGSDG